MRATYDPEVDILYVTLSDDLVDNTEDVSRRRQYERGIDYAADGSLVGYEFMNASRGIDLDGLPHRAALVELLERTRGLRVLQAG
jgi:uncharacterized protein YuzE